MKYHDNIARKIDHAMGWDKDGTSPMNTAKSLGCHCKFLNIKAPFSGIAWVGPDKVWSITVLYKNGIKTTLLARSFKTVQNMYILLCKRSEQNRTEHWNKYYSELWERRYRKWECKKRFNKSCSCQLCRMEKAKIVFHK